jgi:hypothetical protein
MENPQKSGFKGLFFISTEDNGLLFYCPPVFSSKSSLAHIKDVSGYGSDFANYNIFTFICKWRMYKLLKLMFPQPEHFCVGI